MFKTPKPFLVVLLVLLAFVALAQNTVIKQFTDIYIVNDATNAVALKVIKPIANLAPFITLGSQTNEVFSVSSTGLVRAAAFTGDGSQLTGISGGGGSSNFDPLVIATNGSSQVTLKTNNFVMQSQVSFTSTGNNDLRYLYSGTGISSFVGFVRITGTNASTTDRCDVLVHVDALPMTDEAPAICQFQGAISGDPFSLNLSHDGAGAVRLWIDPPDAGWTYVAQGYSDGLPALSLANGGENYAYAAEVFTAVNGQIAANRLQALGFDLLSEGVAVVMARMSGNQIAWGNDNNVNSFAGEVAVSGTLNTIGDLKLGNTAVAETPTATHTIIIKDAAGVSYRVLAVPVE